MVTRYRESPFDVVKNLRLVAGGIHPKAASTDDSRRTVDPREGNNPYAPSVDTPSLTPTVGSEALMGLGDVSKAYQLAATRGDKRISDTKRRVSELVKLDPTNPLALLVTMLGAREEALTTQELDKLRGKDARNEAKKKRDKKFEADVKFYKFQDEVGELLTSPKYGGNREKMMKAYAENPEQFFKDLQEIASEISASEASGYGAAVSNLTKTLDTLKNLLRGEQYNTIEEYEAAVAADPKKRLPEFDNAIEHYDILKGMVGTLRSKYGTDGTSAKNFKPTGQEISELTEANKKLEAAKKKAETESKEKGKTRKTPGLPTDDATARAKKLNDLKEALGGKKGIKLERQTDGATKTPPLAIDPSLPKSPLGTYKDKEKWEEEFRVTLPPLTAKIVGQTNEGRDIYEDVKGGRASERSTTFQTPSGHWFNFPTIFGGRIVSEDEAVEIFMENGGVDPETNINYGEKPYSTQEEAVKAAEARSSGIEEFSTSDIPLVSNQFYEEEDETNPALAITPKTDQLRKEKDDYRDLGDSLTREDRPKDEGRIPPINIPQQPDGKIIEEELDDLAKTLLPKGAKTSKEVAQLEKDIKVIDKLIEDGVIAETDPTGASNRYTGGVTIVTEGAELPLGDDPQVGYATARKAEEERRSRNELLDRTMGKSSTDPLADLREAPVADEFIRKDKSLGSYGGMNLDNIEQGTRQKKDDGVYDATQDTDLRRKMALDNPVGKFLGSLTVDNAKKAYRWAEGKAGIVADSIRAWHRKNMDALKPHQAPPLDNTIPVDPDAPDNFDIRNYKGYGSNTPDDDLRGRSLPNMPVGTGQQGQQVVSLPEELRGGPIPAGTKKRGRFAGMAIPELMPDVGFGGPDTSGGGQAIEEDKKKTVDEITPEYKKSMVEHWRQNPVTESLIQTESSGNAKAIGYKIKWDDGQGKFVYVKDKDGKKIPQSYGLMQMTLSTAAATKWGEKIFKGKDKKERVQLLFDPYHNMKMSKEFTDKLKKQFDENKYTKDWDEIDKNILVGMAYNWKGEGLSKKVIDVIKPEKFQDILYKASKFGIKIPKQTRRQIRVFRKKLGNFNF